jgi:hypothetical protein
MPSFPIVDISSWEVVAPEVLGRNPKVWVREPGGGSDRQRDWLFKPVVVAANGHRQGEDWAEKIVSELGRSLGVPCAEVQLAVRAGVRALISRNVSRTAGTGCSVRCCWAPSSTATRAR